MPHVIVKLLEGRTIEQKRQLVQEITEVVVRVAKSTEDHVDVLIDEYPRSDWAKAGTLFCDQ